MHQMAKLSVLMEEAMQIAWDYLDRSGDIDDEERCGRILADSIKIMILQGVRSRLLLSNRAIDQYMRTLRARALQVA